MGVSINQLPSSDIERSDQLPFFSSANGQDRRTSVYQLAEALATIPITPDNSRVFTVDAITSVDAITLELANNDVVIANGRTTAGDGGGGTFRYVAASTQTVDGGVVFQPTAGSGRLFRDGWATLPLRPEFFGAFAGGVDRTTELDAMFTYARTLSRKAIEFGPGIWRYEGTGLQMTGAMWEVTGQGEATVLTRQTNGPFFVLDARVTGMGYVGIRGFRCFTTLADGARGSTYAVDYKSDGNFGYTSVTIQDVFGSGLHAVIHGTATSALPYDGINQLMRYYKCTHINIQADDFNAGSGNYPRHGFLWDSGTGQHLLFLGGVLQTLQAAAKFGDGIMACHDTTFSGVHFLGQTGGIHIIGPTDPLRYNRNIAITGGCQFDNGTSAFSYKLENLSYFTVLGNNAQATGSSPVLINCTLPYITEDQDRGVTFPELTVATAATFDGTSDFDGVADFNTTANFFGAATLGVGGTLNTTLGKLVDTNGTRVAQSSFARRDVDDSSLQMSGGATISTGGRVRMYGPTHATLPNFTTVNGDSVVLQNQAGSVSYLTASGSTCQLGSGAWNSASRLALGAFQFWVDASGRLRIKNGAPTSDTDGTIVGTQS